VCATYSRAYLRHLFKADEMLGPRLLSLHNLHFYGALMRKAREMIRVGELSPWVEATLVEMRELDEIGGAGID
jgi:queuine tRNA-ribosyltransferase